nr:Imm15 family immunity protein [uncultured Fretibacterium sp.]
MMEKNTLIADIYKRIIKKTGLDNLDYFIEEHEGGYEEMPISNTFPQAEFLKGTIKSEEISALLLNIALFFVNTILLYAYNKLTEKQFANFFIAIFVEDFNRFDEYYGDFGYFLPRILVSREADKYTFVSQETLFDYKRCEKFYKHISKVAGLRDFTFYRRYDDKNDLEIIYMVPNREGYGFISQRQA